MFRMCIIQGHLSSMNRSALGHVRGAIAPLRSITHLPLLVKGIVRATTPCTRSSATPLASRPRITVAANLVEL